MLFYVKSQPDTAGLVANCDRNSDLKRRPKQSNLQHRGLCLTTSQLQVPWLIYKTNQGQPGGGHNSWTGVGISSLTGGLTR